MIETCRLLFLYDCRLMAVFIDLLSSVGMIVGLMSLVAFWLVSQGWNMVLLGMEGEMKKQE